MRKLILYFLPDFFFFFSKYLNLVRILFQTAIQIAMMKHLNFLPGSFVPQLDTCL